MDREHAVRLTDYEARVISLAMRDVNYGGEPSKTREAIREKLRDVFGATRQARTLIKGVNC